MNHPAWRWAALALLPLAQAGQAADLFVAPTGQDSSPGTQAAPLRTIQKAADLALPGDTVYIRGGTYNAVVRVSRSGLPGQPITFTRYPGETPILDATGKTPSDYWNGVFAIRGSASQPTRHIRVVGLQVQNNTSANGFGISCYDCADVEIRDNKVFDTYLSGIVVGYGTRVVVDRNDIEKANNGGAQENLSILRESSFVTVTRNVVHDNGLDRNGGEGIDIKQGAHDVLVQGNTVYNNSKVGIYVDAWDKPTYNIRIEGNRIYNVAKSAIALGSECGGALRNVTVANNLIHDNSRHGIHIGVWGDAFGQCGSPAPTPGNIRDIRIVNNTIVGNGQVGIHYTRTAGIPVHPEFGNLYVANNIVHDNGHKALKFTGCPISHNGHADVAGHFTIAHNLLAGPTGFPRCDWGGEMLGSPHFLTQPQLVGGGDFRLKATSPAIDMGSALQAPERDYDGQLRPVNGAWDLGAYESSLLPPALDILTTALPAATAGSSYGSQLAASGGRPPYTWQLGGGALPGGLTLSSSGSIAGTPLAAGSSSFTVAATDAAGASDVQALSLAVATAPVSPPPDIVTTTLAAGTVGSAYRATLAASAGTAPYAWSLASGSLPAGLSLDSAGTLAGTPTLAGTANFTVRLTDSRGQADSQALALTIGAAPPPTGSQADMSLTVFKATKAVVTRGTAAEFSFTVKNLGSSTAGNARFVLPLPGGLAWVKGGSGSECQASTTQVTCSFGSLAGGASRTRYLYLRPATAGVYPLTGSALADATDPNPGNNSSSVSLTAQ